MNYINIFVFGGFDENGKNCYILEIFDEKGENKKIYVINLGVKVFINLSNKIDILIFNFNYLIKNKDVI